MKVLWFSNSPCGSIRRFSNGLVKSGGWLISLEDELKSNPDITLEVAFFSDKGEVPFVFEGVQYYPINKNIFNQKYGINRVLERCISIKRKDEKATKAMLDIIGQSHPDIIHIHGTEESFGLIIDYVKNIPIVFSIQGLIAPYKEKYFSGIPQQQAYRLDSFSNRIRGIGIKRQYHSFCYRAEREKMYLSHAKYIFGRTFWDKECTLALNPQRKYFTVNEILRPEFYTKRWKGYISQDKITIVSTISGGIYKGFETVLKTASLLKQYSNLDFEWHIAGYTQNSQWVDICEKITQIQSRECNIIFHGRIDAEELSDLLCDSDIYVQVSHIENSPNSVCEAMIIGMPIIASYAGGTKSLLKDGEEGVLYQDGEPYVLAGLIISYIKEANMAIGYSNNAYKQASLRHNKNSITKELLSGYVSIIADYKKNSKSDR